MMQYPALRVIAPKSILAPCAMYFSGGRIDDRRSAEPALKLRFISHGTLQSKDLKASRKFYEEFLGFDVVRIGNISLMVRLGGNHVYAVVENRRADSELPFLNHNGIDVLTESEVDQEGRGHWSNDFERPEKTRTT